MSILTANSQSESDQRESERCDSEQPESVQSGINRPTIHGVTLNGLSDSEEHDDSKNNSFNKSDTVLYMNYNISIVISDSSDSCAIS